VRASPALSENRFSEAGEYPIPVRYFLASSAAAARQSASNDRSMSSSVVAQEDTEIRSAV
jgi:hypothetical protein